MSSMKKKIAVVLNTSSHVETAISLYFTLARSNLWQPTLIVLAGNPWGLHTFLRGLEVTHSNGSTNPETFDFSVIVTAYPQGAEYEHLPLGNDPFLKAMQGRRLLITHRSSHPRSSYGNEPVVGLTSFCIRRGLDFLYMCENPALESVAPPLTEGPRRFLVQGKFGYAHRDLGLLQTWLANNRGDARILLVGENAHTVLLSDPRVEKHDRVEESAFYALCASVHFILPLIDRKTRRGSYLFERFSSSYGLAFASGKPVVASRDMGRLYRIPALAYDSPDTFCSQMNACLNMDDVAYRALAAPYGEIKRSFRAHNLTVLKKYLPV
jgi:hypothetical protein